MGDTDDVCPKKSRVKSKRRANARAQQSETVI